jgi:hypothetical protein
MFFAFTLFLAMLGSEPNPKVLLHAENVSVIINDKVTITQEPDDDQAQGDLKLKPTRKHHHVEPTASPSPEPDATPITKTVMASTCSGFIIKSFKTTEIIATAAHCIYDDPISMLGVTIGESVGIPKTVTFF